MILRALYDYYHRCGDLAPEGMEYKDISFLVVMDKEGNFKRLERRGDGKRGQPFLVMKGIRSGTTPKPYLFWDNVEYVLNYTKEHDLLQTETDEKKAADLRTSIAKSQAKNDALVKKLKDVAAQFPEEPDFNAVCLFYEQGGLDLVRQDDLWPDVVKKPTVNVSFLIEGSTKIVAENPSLRKLADTADNEKPAADHICLITGEQGNLIESTTPTPIAGGQAIGRLVAFQINSGYDSYGKEKGLNAPISKEAEASYTTALRRLLDKNSRNKFMLGGRTFVFWASGTDEACQKMEQSLFDLLGYSADDDKDDPNAKIEEARKVFNAIYSGTLKTEMDDRFYILGLAPNAARIAVVFWSETSLRDFAEKINRHFADMQIADTRKDRWPYYGLREMLSAVTLGGKQSDATPNLPEAVAKSIFCGLPYPQTLYTACLRRIRAEAKDGLRIGRAAIIKAYLNRLNDNKNKKISVMLDKENKNQGYLCGRLFAVLDKIQKDTYGISSIRERYMNSASTTPAAVFATILNLSSHHSEKLSGGSNVFYEKIKQEIIAGLPADGFPAHLDLQDQGRFFVGYYHQMQDLFTSKEDKAEE